MGDVDECRGARRRRARDDRDPPRRGDLERAGSWSPRSASTRSATASTRRRSPPTPSRSTTRARRPAHRHEDGKDFVPTNKWVVFGHHFAAIAGPGPLVGPILAAQFGYLPGTLYILAGVVLGGAVQDMTILIASMRRDGKSLGQMVRDEIGPVGGAAALIGVLAIMVILIGVLGLVVVNAHVRQPVGDLDRRRDDPDRAGDGRLHDARAAGPRARGEPRRRRAGAARGRRGALGGRERVAASVLRPRQADARAAARRLRLRRERAAGVAAARAARLPLRLREARHRGAARDRARDRAPARAAPGAHASSSTARAPSSPVPSSRSVSSRSPAARSRASTR